MSALRVAITGSGGYVGRALARAFSQAGHDVVALSRRSDPELEWRRYELAGFPDPDLLDGIDVIVHCAYDLTLTRPSDIRRVNIEGTRRLLDLAAAARIRFCLISSMSAYDATRQVYGRAKLASERDVLRAGGDVVRLGLVYGGAGGGMIGSLARIARLPVIPVVARSSHQYTICLSDMTRAIVRLVQTPQPFTMPLGLAHPQPVMFGDILKALAAGETNRPHYIPIPWQPVYAAMRAAEAIGIRLPIRADSLLGLVRPAPEVPNPEIWSRLGVDLRAFELE